MQSIVSKIFKQEKKYLNEEQIIRILISYNLSEDDIVELIEHFKNGDYGINIDKYYQEHMTKHFFKKLSPCEKVRFIVRNTNINSEYGNFHNVEYRFIAGMIFNELIKMGMANHVIDDCTTYINEHPNEQYDGDRFICNYNSNKIKIAYDNHFYRLRKLFIVYDKEHTYYCVRHLIQCDGEVNFLGNRYYREVNYEYYDINTKKMICDDTTDNFGIIPLSSIYDESVDNRLLYFNEVKDKVKQYIKRI